MATGLRCEWSYLERYTRDSSWSTDLWYSRVDRLEAPCVDRQAPDEHRVLSRFGKAAQIAFKPTRLSQLLTSAHVDLIRLTTISRNTDSSRLFVVVVIGRSCWL